MTYAEKALAAHCQGPIGLLKGGHFMHPHMIRTAEPFESLFPIDNDVLNRVIDDMRTKGFDQAQPLFLWNGVVIDGHTRLMAAQSLGLEDVPIVVKEFANEDEAVEYAIHCQRDRRNLTDADVMRLVKELDRRKLKGERTDLASGDAKSGKSAAETAEKIGVSQSKVERTRTVIRHADELTKEAVSAGRKTIQTAYLETQAKRKREQDTSHHDKAVIVPLESQSDECAIPDVVQVENSHMTQENSATVTECDITATAGAEQLQSLFDFDAYLIKGQKILTQWLEQAPEKVRSRLKAGIRKWFIKEIK